MTFFCTLIPKDVTYSCVCCDHYKKKTKKQGKKGNSKIKQVNYILAPRSVVILTYTICDSHAGYGCKHKTPFCE